MTPRHLYAVATHDPFAVGTFSGYSANLFRAIEQLGVSVTPVRTRDVLPTDLVRGAVNLGYPLARLRGRAAPKLDPNWWWSRRGHERAWARFEDNLATAAAEGPLLQVGTHVRTTRPGMRSFCVTDQTVAQSVEAGRFSVARARRPAIEEAMAAQRDVLHGCEKVFVLSSWAARSVVDDCGVPAERVVVVGAGANVDDASARPVRAIDVERPFVLFVGYDWDRKGGPLLVEAMTRVRRTLPAARLVVVGCRPDVGGPGIEVIGPLDRNIAAQRRQLFDLYAGASVFSIVPAFDPFPNVLLEAGAFGVPVVSTDVGSRDEVVHHGRDGLLAPPGDVDAIAELLRQLLADPARADRLGAAARAQVVQRFTWPLVAGHVLGEMGLGKIGPDGTGVS